MRTCLEDQLLQLKQQHGLELQVGLEYALSRPPAFPCCSLGRLSLMTCWAARLEFYLLKQRQDGLLLQYDAQPSNPVAGSALNQAGPGARV